ncbi:MAG: serine/threonine protein kinase [Planctomycetes bacterium]|nr:serine/threonine protein kinase [Planctomycetota bacterium]
MMMSKAEDGTRRRAAPSSLGLFSIESTLCLASGAEPLPWSEPRGADPHPDRIGPYRILRGIGGGSSSDVYLACDERNGSVSGDVAIKFLRTNGERDAERRAAIRSRFRRECEILAAIRHRNVVRLIAWSLSPTPHLVMEFLPGGSLQDLIANSAPLEVGRALAIARGILEGLRALHGRGVIHRDLKPANILLREDGEACLADLGLARSLAFSHITMRSTIIGTLAYMAPEQLRGEPADERADIYAVGGILYQLLTGRFPFGLVAPADLIRRIIEVPPSSLSALRPDLPRGVAACVHRSLEKDPAMRYRSASDLLAALFS